VRGLLPDEEIEATREHLFTHGANVKRIYNTATYNNLDIYQINCTYYSALGENDDAYLLARALQFFSPGTPQVYYVGLLAGRNDIQLLEETKEGRNINRHYYSREEIAEEVQRPVVQRLIALMELRSTHPAFNGDFSQTLTDPQHLMLTWKSEAAVIELHADLESYEFEIVGDL
jgi:sucrose phosphorylase